MSDKQIELFVCSFHTGKITFISGKAFIQWIGQPPPEPMLA